MFLPEAIRPLPKAPPRKLTNRGRKTRISTIYTDTPENVWKEYVNILKHTKAKQVMKRLHGGETKTNAGNRKKENTQNASSSSKEECYCLVCMSRYSESRPILNGYNAQNVKCGRMKNVQKVFLIMFATFVIPIDI
ncbi:unnamed protein product [Pieris macdunnoughi]|uniref:Uncharacterized protein n=1 Tax=Pieris macdunnoughi TaxID=345717 RepID=A0A821UDF5_9NEOP|nr:unnamed protein product [Pieris macdunnoughi]